MGDEAIERRRRRRLNWLITLGAAVAAGVAGYILLGRPRVEWVSLSHPWLVAVAFLVVAPEQCLAALLPLMVLRSLGERARYRPLLWISMLAASANSAAPFPAGLPIRAVLQKRVLGIPYAVSAGALAIESVVVYAVTATLGLASGLVWLAPLAGSKLTLAGGPLGAACLVGGAMAVCGGVAWLAGRRRAKWAEFARNAAGVVRSARKRWLFAVVPLLAVSLALPALRLLLILKALGASAHAGGLFAAMILSYLAGLASFVPMGLGVRDVSLASLILLLGAPGAAAAACVIIDRALTIAPYLAGGVIAAHVLGPDLLDGKREAEGASGRADESPSG